MKVLVRLLAALGGLVVLLVIVLAGLVLFMPGIHTSSIEMALNVMTGRGSDQPQDELLSRLTAADGYRISIFADGIENPRMLARDAAGRVFVSSPRSGEVLQLVDRNGDGAADGRQAILSGLRRPHGLALHEGFLYVAESNQVGRIGYNPQTGSIVGEYQVVVGGFTDEGNHWSKSIAIDDSGWLYVAMGSTCNVCEETDQRRATIMRFDTESGEGKTYASGLRNSVGLGFAPWNGALYATDNGRDLLGDDFPPCELNRIEEGGFYGWPYLNGNGEPDPDFGQLRPDLQAQAIPPVYGFRAHNAPLGIYFPGGSEKQALVALHGSWNRSQPDGYRVVKLVWQDDGSIQGGDFMWGFEESGNIVGRPVDIIGDGDGGYLVSDDYARVIYRLSRESGLANADRPAAGGTQVTAAIDPLLAARGESLYKSMPCDECHGADAATPVTLDKLPQRYSLDSLADYFLTPTPPMPRYELDAMQREQLAHYLLSRS